MHGFSLLEDDIKQQVWVFEGLEKLRTACDRKLTHLGKRRQCQCGTFYYPRIAKTRCPDCGGRLKSVKKVMTCAGCGYKAGELGCPDCRDKEHWQPAPKDHSFIRTVVLPELKSREDDAEAKLIGLVKEHPVWEWAEGIKGLGATSVARMVSACDIERCTTLSKYFAHEGWGLRRDGTPQRKVKGEKLDYDSRSQSIAYMVAISLEMQRGKYYNFYEDWKEENKAKGLSDGQATSRAFRNMVQLMLSHFYEKWRKGVSLEYVEPYPYTVLRPPHNLTTKIKPEEMMELKKGR